MFEIALTHNVISAEEMVKHLISRIVLVIWLFFLVVLKSIYTASLTSMLTVQQLQPTVTNVDELLKTGESVGYPRSSYIKGLLEELGFDASKIKPYEIPYIKLFLAEHCKGYTMVGPIYKTAGFGYVSLTVFIKFITSG
jgi:ionotropic glutamate receptor